MVGDVPQSNHPSAVFLQVTDSCVSQESAIHCSLGSCSSPICDSLPSGHQRYPLLGLILGYMYWGQKHSSEYIETYQYMQNKVVHVLMFFFRFKGKK